MTEIIMPVIAANFKKSSPSKRRAVLDGLAVALHPLSKGAIGLMIDNNNLDAAINVVRRVNERAQAEFITRAKEYRDIHNAPFPIAFKPPFHHSPAHPAKEAAEWGSMLRTTIANHL